jgi:surface protein
MFTHCKSLSNIDALANWNTGNVEYMNYMFGNCYLLLNINALTDWNTSKVHFMRGMFEYCKSLSNIDGLKNWDTKRVNDIFDMFYNCESLSWYPKTLKELKAFTSKTTNNSCMQFDKLKKFVCNFKEVAEEFPNKSNKLDVIRNWDGAKIPTWA